MALEEVIEAARALENSLDEFLEQDVGDMTLKGLVDWAWYRFSTINVLVRDRGSGVTAACLARGLLEEAAFWDWRAATGADTYWIAGQAVAELNGLVRRAQELGDDVWTEWLVPPGTSFFSPGRVDPPSSTADAVARIGHGLPSEYYEALPLNSLRAVYRLLNTLSHGNVVATGAVRASGGWEGTDELSALALHIGGAACALVAIGALGLSPHAADELTRRACELAKIATRVHGMEGRPDPVKGRAARPTSGPEFSASSTIQRMPGPPPAAVEVGTKFTETATALLRRHGRSLSAYDAFSDLAGEAVRFGASQLDIVKGVLDDAVGQALLPYAARPTMELGALWSWVADGLRIGRPEFRHRLQTVIGASCALVERAETEFSQCASDVPVARFLGDAVTLRDVAAAEGIDGGVLPKDHREIGFDAWGGADWSIPTYGVLSQFLHVTPIAFLHLKPGAWHSVSAPVFCVALDAFARGFTVLMRWTLPLAGVPYEDVESDLLQLSQVAMDVRATTSNFHFIG